MKRARALLPATLVALSLAVPASAEQVVCVRVKLEIPQKLTFERDAFEATLRLTNRLTDAPLEGVDVAVEIRNLSAGAPAEPIFIAAPTLSGVSGGIDGAGQIVAAGQGVIQWLLIPAPGAGGQFPGGLQYAVKATLQYQANGVVFETETFEEVITVRPQPNLSLRYFLPRHVRGDNLDTPVVEPPVPFELGVRVKNVGYGPARNLQIESAQPRIEENDAGLLASFDLVGTWRNAEIIPNTLSIPFGTLDPARCAMGAWAMETTYPGKFVELDVSFQHSEELGGEFTSLISSATSDWLIHRVVDDRAGKDAVFDALIDLNASNDGVPERVLGSDCTDQAVSPQTGNAAGSPSGVDGDAIGTFSMPVTVGWNWASAADPANGALPLLKVIRDRDGKELHQQNAWLDVDDDNQPIVALFDHSVASGVETYTLYYDLTDFDDTPPTTVISPREPYAWLDAVTLFVSSTTVMLLSATDDAAGVAYSEMSIDGGALEPNRPFYFSSGTHTVELRSVDRKGNVETMRLVTVIVDDTAPSVTLTSPIAGASMGEEQSFLVDFDVSDDNDPAPVVSAEIRREDGSVALVVSDGQTVVPFALAPGLYTLVIEAADFVENGGIFPASIEILEKPAGPPRLVVDGLSDGQHVSQPVTLVVSVASDDPIASSTITLNGAPFVQNTVVSVEAEHLLHLDAEDAAGRIANEDFRFVVDLTPPTFSVLGVVPGRIYTTGVAPVVSANDEHLASFEASLDGAPFLSGDVVTLDGAHTLDLVASDLAGNEASRQIPFVVDLLPPAVTFSVEDGALYAAPVAPVISIADATEVSSSALLNGKAFLSGAPVGDGAHWLVVDASDETGKSTHAEVRFRVDSTPPRVRILGVGEGGVYAAGIAVTLDIEEPNLVEVVILLDGVSYVEGTPISEAGVHLLSVSASDEAGHTTTQEVLFTIDPDAPSITVEGVEDGATYAGTVLPVISTDDDATLNVLLNGAPWDGEAITADGKHVLVITATDPEGHESRVTVRFTIDTTPPAVVVTGVVDGGVYAGAVTPDVVAESEDIASLSATLDDALFGLGSVVSTPGQHTLIITVVDEAGNQVQLTYSFEIDPTAPSLTLLGIGDGEYRNVAVSVTAEAEAGAALTLTLDGQPYSQGDLVEGEGRHIVSARALVGEREAVAGLTFTLDFTAPEISVLGVEDGAFYASATAPVWSASDQFLADVFAELDGGLVGEGVTIEAEGPHALVVTATDRAGNETVTALSFTIDSSAPVVVLEGVSEGAVLEPPVAATVTVLDDNLATATLSLDGAPYVSGAEIAPGDHVLDVKAVDLAGNLTQQVVAFRVESPRRALAWLTKDGVPVAGALVFLHEPSGAFTGESARTDDDGIVSFEDVDSGSYRLRVHHGWQRYLTPTLEVPGAPLAYALPEEPSPLGSLYVDAAAGDGGDGSLEEPFATIAAALASASWGTTVKVAAGVYEESALAVPEGVTVRGGFLPGAFAFAPGESFVIVTGDGERPLFTFDDVEHAVLSDLLLRDGGGAEGGAIRSVDSSPLLRDLVLRRNSGERGGGIFVDGGEHAHLVNLLVTQNDGDEAVLVTRSPAVIENVSVARNQGDGLRHDGPGGEVLRGVFAFNGGAGLISDDDTVRASDCLSGENLGAHFGGSFASAADEDGNRSDTPVFRNGPLHPYYLAQVRGGDDDDTAGVDGASIPALALDLRGRTTAVTGAPDIGSADLGYHAWPVEPVVPGVVVPPECGCSSTNEALPPRALALMALFTLGLALVRRRRAA